MIMTKLNCIYIERRSGEKNTIEVELQKIEQLNVGVVRQTVWKNKRTQSRTGNVGKQKMDKEDKKLWKIIKKLCDKETVIMVNEPLVTEYSLPNIFFEMKKEELCTNKNAILQFLRRGIEKNGRKTFLLMIDSEKWNDNDIREILLEIKNYYENIYVCISNNILDVDNLTEFFYDECGVELHLVEKKNVGKIEVDTVLFLIKEWTNEYAKIDCRNGYLVSESEKGLLRKRKRIQQTGCNDGNEKKEIYMGFVYAYCGKQMIYELGLLLENHTGLRNLYGQHQTMSKISIVAIYAVEWYNITCLQG